MAGAPTFVTTAAGQGSNGSGGTSGLAGQVRSTDFVSGKTDLPGAYLVSSTVFDATLPFSGSFVYASAAKLWIFGYCAPLRHACATGSRVGKRKHGALRVARGARSRALRRGAQCARLRLENGEEVTARLAVAADSRFSDTAGRLI